MAIKVKKVSKLFTLLDGQHNKNNKIMKEFNLMRLMDSCCVTIDREYYDELMDYLLEGDVDLNTLNIDDLVVNGVQFLDKDDFEEGDYYTLKETDTGCWVI